MRTAFFVLRARERILTGNVIDGGRCACGNQKGRQKAQSKA